MNSNFVENNYNEITAQYGCIRNVIWESKSNKKTKMKVTKIYFEINRTV